ncbi:hypothetical protein BI380_14325 [Delftia tsuruhatensis]|uniref:Uncharacterized protein n=2 Tax=Delftia tsuruhatensis TaxID=180282 RepID=A0ABN4SFS0_9BURK|nr:hypothetical protein BI380_14325 [Delftia tsuruhatensis]
MVAHVGVNPSIPHWDLPQRANAALIAEAGTVHHETGLTPRQLVEQRDALAATLGEICGLSPAIRFGGPDPMDLEELSDALSSAVDLAHSALALVKGAKP